MTKRGNNIAVERAKRQWELVADSMPQLICLIDAHGRVVRANRTLERWNLGLVTAACGMSLHDLLHKDCDSDSCYLRRLAELATARQARGRRLACKSWDPVLKRHLKIQLETRVRVRDVAAPPDDWFALATVDDVTGAETIEHQSQMATRLLGERLAEEIRRRAKAEEVRARMETILERTNNLVAMSDAKGAIFYLNPAGRDLLGLRADDELDGMTVEGFHAPGVREFLVRDAAPMALRDGKWTGDSVLQTCDGRELRSYMVLIAHSDGNGELDGYSVIERDMTAWVRNEEALCAMKGELHRLCAQHLTIQESERRRIAADLHDGLGQSLSLIKLSTEEVSRLMGRNEMEKAAASLKRLLPRIKGTIAEVRRIAMELRPSTLDDLGLMPTLSWFLRELEESSTSIKVERDIRVVESDVPEPLKVPIFRILQEAVSNMVKHAHADRLKVSLHNGDDSIRFSIEDNGAGFDPVEVGRSASVGRGLGLQSMKERAELSGGRYALETSAGCGTRVLVQWPSGKPAAS